MNCIESCLLAGCFGFIMSHWCISLCFCHDPRLTAVLWKSQQHFEVALSGQGLCCSSLGVDPVEALLVLVVDYYRLICSLELIHSSSLCFGEFFFWNAITGSLGKKNQTNQNIFHCKSVFLCFQIWGFEWCSNWVKKWASLFQWGHLLLMVWQCQWQCQVWQCLWDLCQVWQCLWGHRHPWAIVLWMNRKRKTVIQR